MPVSVTHTQTRSVEEGPAYVVYDVVDASDGIAPEVFVFRTDDDAFNRIATIGDMTTLPAGKAAAVAAGADYYRLPDVTRSFASLSAADNAATGISQRIQLLVVEYDAAVTSFIGTTTETLSS